MDAMDLLQGVQDMGAETAGPQLPPDMGEFKMPSLEQMMDLLSKMDMPEEEKAKILEGFTNKAEVLANLAGKGAERISNAMSSKPGAFNMFSIGSGQFYLLFIMLSILICIFVFFGFKLYRSLTEKERKREEKKKLKQQKKKK